MRENQGANWGFSEGKAYLYHGLFFFYESQQEASIEQDSTGEGGSGDAQGFGRLDADSRASFTGSRTPPTWTSELQFSSFLLPDMYVSFRN